MEVAGIMSHPSPQGPLESTSRHRWAAWKEGSSSCSAFPTLSTMTPFRGLPLAVEGEALVGKAEHDFPEGPKGPIRLVRQPAAPR